VLFIGGAGMTNDDREYMYELKINQYEFERMWLEDLHRNSWLSGDHKVLLWEIRQVVKRMRYDLSEPVHIWIMELANRTGLGYSSVKRLTDELNAYGLITKETKGKGKEQRTWFNLGGTIRTSAKEIVIPDREHGGIRQPRCKKCNSDDLEPIAYKCRGCGHQWHL
jgi:hypothetical protein